MRTGDVSRSQTYDRHVTPDLRRGHANVHGIALDFSAWPIVQVTPPPYSVSDDALMEFMEFHRQLVRGKDAAHGLVLDLRHSDQISGSQRKKLAEILKSPTNGPISPCAGTALVFNSPVLRGMLTAMFWFFRPPYPVRVFPDVTSAERWLSTLLTSTLVEVA